MSPRAVAALHEATELAERAEKRCKAVLSFRGSVGQRCDGSCVVDSPFCWTHTAAASNEHRRSPVLMSPAYVGSAR